VPNTLAQLNTFSNQSYTFEDQRDYAITFSANATSNQSVAVAEDVSFTSPVGIDITGMISQPGNITYNINTSNIGANAILTWPALPSSVSSSNPSTGVYRVTGIMDNVVWDQIKNPTILAKDQAANFVYSANIQYPSTANTANTNTWSWTNSVTISNTHSELSNATNFTYDEDVPKTIPGTPTITDVYSGPLKHTLVISPNVANAVFSLSMSGNTSLNPVTKALTIVDTKANINTGLGNLWLVPYPDYDQTFSLNYSLTNPISNLNTQVNQLANIGNTQTDFTMTTAYNYSEGAATQLVFNVDDGDTTATSFTISVDQTLGTDGIFFVNGSNFGVGNVGSFTGNRTAFNGANITFLPNPDAADTVNITANVYKINGVGNVTVASNVVSTLTNTGSHAEFTLTTAYNVGEDATVPMVFQITDTDVNANNYVSTFTQTSGDTGVFIVNGTSQGVGNSAVLSNSKANINAANVSFLPAPDDTGSVGLTYSQIKTNTYFGNIVQANAVAIAVTNTSSHADYSLTTNYNYSEDQGVPIVFAITDTDPRATSYTVTLQDQTASAGAFFVNGVSSGAGNAGTITGNISTVNAANIVYFPYADYTGSVSLYYNQSKVNSIFGNIVQAANVNVSMTCTTAHAEYSFAPGSYTEDTDLSFVNLVTDLDPNAPDYYITLQQVAGNTGRWIIDNVNIGNATTTYSLDSSKTGINNTLIKFRPAVDSTSNVTIRYNQTKFNSVFGFITQAANVDGIFTCGTTNPEISNMIGVARSYVGNTVNSIFSASTPTLNDGADQGQTYAITLSSTLGKFGNSQANAIASASYSFTGNTTQVNNEFALMKFVPNRGTSSSGTFNYTQTRDGTSQVNSNVTLNGTAGAAMSATYTFLGNAGNGASTISHSWTPTFTESYYGTAQMFLVGAGGHGGRRSSAGDLQSGYGGAGGSVTIANVVPQMVTHSIIVPNGPSNFFQPGGNATLTNSSNVSLSAIGGYANSVSSDRSATTANNTVSPSGSFGYGSVQQYYNTPPDGEMFGGAPGAGSSGTNPVTGNSYSTNVLGTAGDGYLYNGKYYGAGGKSGFFIATSTDPNQNIFVQGNAGVGWSGNTTYVTTSAGAGGDTGYISGTSPTPGQPGIVIITIS
jgi:hypothetical protein